jgi:hypothetical protein
MKTEPKFKQARAKDSSSAGSKATSEAKSLTRRRANWPQWVKPEFFEQLRVLASDAGKEGLNSFEIAERAAEHGVPLDGQEDQHLVIAASVGLLTPMDGQRFAITEEGRVFLTRLTKGGARFRFHETSGEIVYRLKVPVCDGFAWILEGVMEDYPQALVEQAAKAQGVSPTKFFERRFNESFAAGVGKAVAA